MPILAWPNADGLRAGHCLIRSFEPAAEDGVPQTTMAGPILVTHPAVQFGLDPACDLWTWHDRLRPPPQLQAVCQHHRRGNAEAAAYLADVAEHACAHTG